MNAVVIGLGSMGRRRIRLLKDLLEVGTVVGVDLSLERREQTGGEFGVETFDSLSEAIAECHPRLAFVCSSPDTHGQIVIDCLKCGLNVFTEINLISDWYEEAMALAKRQGVKIFLSSTFLYRKEIEYIANAIRGERVNYIYHSGQYLPDWHPWEDYRNFFVSQKRTNACREILAIEFPWIVKTFGDIEDVHTMSDKLSSLDVAFNDNYIISIKHRNGNKGVFCQDVVSRVGLRHLEVFSENVHIFWRGTPGTLQAFDHKSHKLDDITVYETVAHDANYSANIIENAYQDEIKAFVRYVQEDVAPTYGYAEDKAILDLIDEIEGIR